MDKNAIKKYAIWARNELIAKISQKALLYGISEDACGDINADEVNGIILSATEKKQRKALIEQIQAKGYKNVIEEVAYTWFNRFAALRYMEVNNYLPSHTHIFSSIDGTEKDGYDIFKPQVLDEALELEIDGLDRSRIIAYKEENKTEELYKYILVTQCNALNSILPHIFQKLTDYTELLLPDYLLRKNAGGEKGSVLNELVTTIPKADWQDQVQIIGWLYQYYNTEPKDQVFADLKKNIKVSKENIPAATQLFTPDWIVRYMVENSLGRLWLEGHPNEELQNDWKYYLAEAEQESEVAEKLAELRKERAKIEPKDIKIIDPCMGSGHILVYAFDVLMEIYSKYGVNRREAVKSIIINNLYGLDIDQRAFQLAYFAIMMKGRQYDPRFFTRGAEPQVYAIEESNGMQNWSDMLGAAHVDETQITFDGEMIALADEVIDIFHDAKEYGSILDIPVRNYDGLIAYIQELVEQSTSDLFLEGFVRNWGGRVVVLAQQAKVMSQQYDVVVTNPPYMGMSNGNAKITDYVKKNFSDYKSDLFSACMVKFTQNTKENGFLGFLSPYVWMFISSYEKMRKLFIEEKTIETLIQFEYSAFEEATVPICTFVLRNKNIDKKGCYLRLTEYRGGMEVQRQKALEAIETHDPKMYFESNASNFEKIPGSPVAYWISLALFNTFDYPTLGEIVPVKKGLDTGENDKYIRFWHEINYNILGIGYKNSESFSNAANKWAPHDKGGDYRRWYGNNLNVIDWENNGYRLEHSKANLRSKKYYFSNALTWGALSSGNINFRYSDYGAISNTAGSSIYEIENKKGMYILGFGNSKVMQKIMDATNPTLNYSAGQVAIAPIIIQDNSIDKISELVEENITLSRTDWDTFETSWDFEVNPLVVSHNLSSKPIMIGGKNIRTRIPTLADHYQDYKTNTNGRFRQLKENEEELNEIFIDIYGLQDELTPKVANKDVTIAFIFDTKEDILESFKGNNYVLTREDVVKNLISYAVGCMFGRYSTHKEGLIYAGGDGWQEAMEEAYTEAEIARGIPDADAILPICTDNYLDDDITSLFVVWLELTFGAEHLDENLAFIAESLSTKGNTSKEIIRNYFINDFYKDHVKKYQKRPIYWLFDSGKNNGFKALIYMHRYKPDTIARIRTDYVHELQSRYRTAIENLENQIASASGGTSVKLKKKLKELKAQADEAHAYEEKIHHLADQMIAIDLDDGVKVNYAKFQDVLAKIK
jgi:hypothetical protein